VKLLHFGTWLLSWLVRLRLVRSLAPYSKQLLRLSFLFDPLGSEKSGFHMFLSGTGRSNKATTIRIFMVARQVHGPNIPCIPAILLARRIAAGQPVAPGARPCLDLLDLEELLAAISHLDVSTTVTGADFVDRWPRP
jgi:hypothetical protein